VGGGVAEILSRMMPLFRQIGVDMRWDVIGGDERFFGITKKFHNSLQGYNGCITEKELDYFMEMGRMNSEMMDIYGDVVLVHDPQPITLIEKRGNDERKWLWRCHIDLTQPQTEPLCFLRRYIERYDFAIISAQRYLQRNLGADQIIIPPSIDPLSDKNRDLPQATIDFVLDRFGIDKDRPIITQVSRFDKLKNPLGVIEAYRRVKESTDIDCQLVLAGGGATDDPEGPAILNKVLCAAEDDEDIHVLDLPPTSHIEINALQRASTVVVQNSLREGFGLTVTEALWKAKPVIASAVGGIPLQITHNHSGILTESPEDLVLYLKKLLHEPKLAKMLGINGREHVKKNFLITRHIRDYLLLLPSLDEMKRQTIRKVGDNARGLDVEREIKCPLVQGLRQI
jgi:trehalose synthase